MQSVCLQQRTHSESESTCMQGACGASTAARTFFSAFAMRLRPSLYLEN